MDVAVVCDARGRAAAVLFSWASGSAYGGHLRQVVGMVGLITIQVRRKRTET
jgi:hypothetical protein